MLRAVLRRYFLGVVLLAGVLGPVPALAADMEPRAVAEALLAAWNAHDPAKVSSLMADDVSYLDMTVGEPVVGRDEVIDAVVKLFMTAAPDLSWQMKGEPIVAPDAIAFEWHFSGTNTGDWGPDAPATGKDFAFDGMTLIRVRDGKIASQADYYDGLGFQRQLGWIE